MTSIDTGIHTYTGPQWSTWLDHETCAGLGINPPRTDEQTVHMAVLAPHEWPGQGSLVRLYVPEVWGHELRAAVNPACRTAGKIRGSLLLVADTRDHLELCVHKCERRLGRGFRRVPLERYYDPHTTWPLREN